MAQNEETDGKGQKSKYYSLMVFMWVSGVLNGCMSSPCILWWEKVIALPWLLTILLKMTGNRTNTEKVIVWFCWTSMVSFNSIYVGKRGPQWLHVLFMHPVTRRGCCVDLAVNPFFFLLKMTSNKTRYWRLFWWRTLDGLLCQYLIDRVVGVLFRVLSLLYIGNRTEKQVKCSSWTEN